MYCTFTNTANAGHIKVIKHLDGGDTAVAGWTVNGTVDNDPPNSGRFTAPNPTNGGLNASGVTTADVNNPLTFELTTVPSPGGTPVNLSEPTKDGYTLGDVTCDDGNSDTIHDPTGTSGSVNVTVDAGQTWTCVFDNTTNVGHIKVIKHLDGGDTAVAGWTVNGTVDNDPPNSGRFTAPNPTNGGLNASGVTTADVNNPLTFELTTVPSPGGTPVNLSEPAKDGYTLGDVTCTDNNDGTAHDPTGTGGSVDLTILSGENWTCTFNNTTDPGHIRVIKHLDGGDTAVAGWTVNGTVDNDPPNPGRFTAPNPTNGGLNASGETTSDVNNPLTFDLTTVSADGTPVNLSEPTKDGYTLGDVTCTADGQDNQTGTSGAVNVTVNPGETWTCVFDNTTNTGTLRVRKFVDGTQAGGWTITGSNPSSPMTFTPGSQVTSASGFEVFALSQVVAGTGSDLTLTETQQSGFITGAASCTGPRSAQSGATNAGAVTVNVLPGETWDCTFNNSTSEVPVPPGTPSVPPGPVQVSPEQVR